MAEDEGSHRQLSWDILDELLRLHSQEVRAFSKQRINVHLGERYREFASRAGFPRLSSAEEAAGLLPPADYLRLFGTTLRGEITPGLGSRGIVVPERWTKEVEQ